MDQRDFEHLDNKRRNVVHTDIQEDLKVRQNRTFHSGIALLISCNKKEP